MQYFIEFRIWQNQSVAWTAGQKRQENKLPDDAFEDQC